MEIIYAFVKKVDSKEMEPMVVEMNISMQSSTHRFYPCTKSRIHRTAISYKGGVHDVTEGITYPSIEDWDASCVDWNRCDHDCIPAVHVNDRNLIDKQLEAPKRTQKVLRTRQKRKQQRDLEDMISRLGSIQVHEKKDAEIKKRTVLANKYAANLIEINDTLAKLSTYE
jgi:hypothetical protein